MQDDFDLFYNGAFLKFLGTGGARFVMINQTRSTADVYKRQLDTISLGTGFAFVCECYELGFLNKEITKGLELKFGAKDDIMELIHRMAPVSYTHLDVYKRQLMPCWHYLPL